IEEHRLELEIAAINAPELVTIAGSRQDIERLQSDLQVAGSEGFCQLLHVDYAFHSRQMDPFEGELRSSLDGLASERPDVPMFSTVTGRLVSAGELTAHYWWRNMRHPVLFQAGIDAVIDGGVDTFLELGAHPALGGPVRDCLAARGCDGAAIA